MRKLFLLVPCLLVFVSQLSFAGVINARHSVELKDAIGDVRNDDGPGKDIVKVIINSDAKNLHITAVLKENASYYLKQTAGYVMRLHFDTDNNPKTGGKPFWSKKSGFEYQVGLTACISVPE